MFAARNAFFTPRVSTVAFDAISTGSVGSNQTSFGDTITIAADANAAIFWLWIYVTIVTRPTISVTLGGVSMTEHSTIRYYTDGAFFSLHLTAFRLANPPTGSNKAIAVNTSNGVYFGTHTTSYKNVTTIGSGVTTSAATTNLSQTGVTSASGHLLAHAFAAYQANITSYNQTTRANVPYASGAQLPAVIGDAAGASSVNFTASTTSAAWGGMAIDLS